MVFYILGGDLMNIAGITKLSLLDYPDHLACTVFTPGCQFRCPFCHNGKLALANANLETDFSIRNIFDFLKKRIGILDAVCISGGEPLLQDGLVDFIKVIKEMGYLVKLDTNGYLPERLESLLEMGLLDYVAMDIKNCPSHYAETCGINSINPDTISKSIEIIKKSTIAFEFRTTVVREFHSAKDIKNLSDWNIAEATLYLQSFKDSNDQIRPGLHGYNTQEMNILCQEASRLIPGIRLREIS